MVVLYCYLRHDIMVYHPDERVLAALYDGHLKLRRVKVIQLQIIVIRAEKWAAGARPVAVIL